MADANTAAAGAVNDNSGLLFNVTSASASAASIVRVVTYEARADAGALQGTLSASASASSDDGSSSGTAQSQTAFGDTLTLLGPAGYSGSVNLAFNLVVSGGITACSACPAQASVTGNLNVVDPSGLFADGLSSTSFSQSFSGGLDNLVTNDKLFTIYLTTSINSEISLQGNLDAFVGVAG